MLAEFHLLYLQIQHRGMVQIVRSVFASEADKGLDYFTLNPVGSRQNQSLANLVHDSCWHRGAVRVNAAYMYSRPRWASWHPTCMRDAAPARLLSLA
jgi:hypothetical protein